VTDVRDVIIIGSGPAGYTAAIYAARARLAPLVFEGSVTAGGALMQTTDVENFPGFPDGVLGPDLMDSLRKQAERFGAELVPDDVIEVDLAATPKVVKTHSETYQAHSVIVATGSRYRELVVAGEKRLSGHGVSWCATCDGFFFRDLDIAVIGGGDSAMEEATFLTRFAKSVTVVHRRDQLRASKIMQDRAFANPKINFRWDSEVAEVLGEGKVTGLRLRNTRTAEEDTLEVNGVFVAIGHDPRSELFTGQVKTVTDSGGRVHLARTVILAMGSRYRELGIDGEKKLSGHGVSWCATCDGFFFRDQDIAVVGGGDSAIEEATFLTRFARSVTLVHRRDSLRASKIMQDRAFANDKIRFAWDSEVVELLGDGRLSGVRLRNSRTGALTDLAVTGLFVAIGHDPRSEIVAGQVHRDEDGYVLVQHPSTRTNLPGVFASGDLVDHQYRQAVTAAGTGCAAALDAERYLVDLAEAGATGEPAQAVLGSVAG